MRLALRGRSALAAGQLAESKGAFWAAADGYQQAMRAYLPLTSAPQLGADGLERLALDAESRSQAAQTLESRAFYRTEALEAWRRLRGGIWATRSFFKPFGERLDRADAHIAELMADELLASGLQELVRGRDRAQLIADHRALLARDPSPSPWLAIFGFLFFAGWVGSIFALIFKGFNSSGQRQVAAFWRYALSAVGCFGLWMACMWWA